MIQQLTKLKVADNSGAKIVQCIKVLGGSRKKFASIGDTIVVSVKTLRKPSGTNIKTKVTKGMVLKAIIVRTRKEFYRKNGNHLRFGDNAVLIINEKGQLLGSRIFGPVQNELRKLKNAKLLSLASSII